MKPHYKCILLVLSSQDSHKISEQDRPHYPKLKQLWEVLQFKNPNVLVKFVYAGDYVTNNVGDMVYAEVAENYHPGMLTKTLLAFGNLLREYSFDYLIRTNLSTFWHLDNLVDYCNTLPNDMVLQGSLINMHKNWVAGYNMLMSRDVVQCLANNYNWVLNQKVMWNAEDLALSLAATSLMNLVPQQLVCGRYTPRLLPSNLSKVVCVRCKLDTRQETLEAMQDLVNRTYR